MIAALPELRRRHPRARLLILGGGPYEGALREQAARLRRTIRATPEVNTTISKVGRPDDGTDPKLINTVEILVDLKPEKTWRADYDSGKAGPHPQMPEAVGPAADRYKVLYRVVDAILHGETDQTFRCAGKMVAVGPGKRYVVHWQKQ